MKKVIIKEEEFDNSIYNTHEWNQSVNIKSWEHDYVKKQYVIIYEEEALSR